MYEKSNSTEGRPYWERWWDWHREELIVALSIIAIVSFIVIGIIVAALHTIEVHERNLKHDRSLINKGCIAVTWDNEGQVVQWKNPDRCPRAHE